MAEHMPLVMLPYLRGHCQYSAVSAGCLASWLDESHVVIAVVVNALALVLYCTDAIPVDVQYARAIVSRSPVEPIRTPERERGIHGQ